MSALSRSKARFAALLAAALLSACGGQPQRFDLLPDLDLARIVVASDQIFPGGRSGDPELTVGWSGGESDALRVPEESADLDLRVALPGDHRLELEVLAPGSGLILHAAIGHGVTPEALESLPLPAGWNRVELTLPAAVLRRGANRLRLDFERLDEVSDLAAEAGPILVRTIRLRGPDGRALWPERPAAAAFAGEGGALRMPTGSVGELVVGLPQNARLRAVARVERPAGQPGAPVSLRLEALGENGAPIDVADVVLEDGAGTAELRLDDLAADTALLRWTVAGRGNAVAIWERLELEGESPDPAFVAIERGGRALVPPAATGRLGRRDVVLVLLDAARRDAVSAYGGTVPTPAIDALGDTRLGPVMAAAPWTAPSVASMMTGLYPDAHGLQSWDTAIPKSVRSLGESFEAAGYRTVLFSQHPIWGAIPTLRRGFQVQEFVPETERERLPTAEQLFGTDATDATDAPAFALVHLLLPHDPYEPPAPWRGRYTDESPGDTERFAVDSGALHDFRLRRGRRAPVPSAERIAYSRDRYDETMLWTDAVVGELIAGIDGARRDPEPLVILLSDHGEAFYEHGWFLHTRNLYEEMAAIPMLVRWPADIEGFLPAPALGPISTIDLMPTLVDLLALPYEGPGMQGRSLTPWIFSAQATAAAGPGPAYAVTTRVETGSAPPLLAWRDGRYKLLWDTLWERVELYDLETDPGERDDLSRQRPLLTQRLLQGLLAQRHSNLQILSAWRDAGASTELDEESIRRLRALGYLR